MSKSILHSVLDGIAGLPAVSTFAWGSRADCATLSAGAQVLLGVAQDISTDDFFAHVHPDDRVRFQAETATQFEGGGDATRAFRFVRSDGTLRHVIMHASSQYSETTQQTETTGIFIDVTSAHLQSSKSGSTRGRPLGSYKFDIKSGTSVWSPALRAMFMKPSSVPVTFDAIQQQIHPDDRDYVALRKQTASQQPGPYSFTFRVVLPDGTILVVHDCGAAKAPVDPETGQVSSTEGTLTDITEGASETDARTLASNTFWRLVDTAPVGVYAVDADLRMVRISENARPAFDGIEGLLGRGIDEILHMIWPEPFASHAVAQFRHTLATGEPYDADPVIEDRTDRKVLEAYDWSIERIVMEDGRFGVLCYFYDLSERVRAERVLEQQQKRLSLAYDAARMGAWEVDLLSGEAHGTPQLSAIFGEPGFAGDVAELWQRGIHPDDRVFVDAAFEASVRSGVPFDTDFRIVTPAGEVRYLAARGEIICGADGHPAHMIGVDQDITDRKRSEVALRDSAGLMRTVINSTLAFVGVLHPDGTLREVNQPALDFGGLTREDVIGKPFWEVFWWTHDPAASGLCRDAVIEGQAGRTARHDVMVRGAGDRLITIDFLLAPVFDDHGNVATLVASGFDISAREEARARAQALMGEINHRTKNILTLVQAVARQTARGGAEDFISRFEERLNALAKAQDLLFQSTADNVDLHDLAKSQLDHFGDLMERRICLTGPDINLGSDAAQAIGMALHELGTNAGKYGALSSGEGRVDVVWDVSADTKGFTLHWTERDGPEVVAPQAKGFGSTVIDQMTKSVLNAEVQLEYPPEGVKWRLACDIAALSA